MTAVVGRATGCSPRPQHTGHSAPGPAWPHSVGATWRCKWLWAAWPTRAPWTSLWLPLSSSLRVGQSHALWPEASRCSLASVSPGGQRLPGLPPWAGRGFIVVTCRQGPALEAEGSGSCDGQMSPSDKPARLWLGTAAPGCPGRGRLPCPAAGLPAVSCRAPRRPPRRECPWACPGASQRVCTMSLLASHLPTATGHAWVHGNHSGSWGGPRHEAVVPGVHVWPQPYQAGRVRGCRPRRGPGSSGGMAASPGTGASRWGLILLCFLSAPCFQLATNSP